MESMERSSRKVRTGIVVSDAREKTVTVAIELQFPHPKYKKIVKKTRKLHAPVSDTHLTLPTTTIV